MGQGDPMIRHSVSKIPEGASLGRLVQTLALCREHGDEFDAAGWADKSFATTPQFGQALRFQKTAVAAGGLNDPSWSALGTSGISNEVLPVLRTTSAFEACRSFGMRQMPFRLRTPRQTDAGT